MPINENYDARPAANGTGEKQADRPGAIVAEQPYQLLPPLSAAEYAALRADVEAHGIRVPIDVDEDGQVLDGHHRQRIAGELGIPCPVRVLTGLTEDDKRAHAVAVNVHRRTLTVSQRRELVLAELARDPSRSDRAIGRLCGVDHKTVAAGRRGEWGIPHRSGDPLSEAEEALLAELTAEIRDQLFRHDMELLRWLIRGVPPAKLVGELAEAWRAYEKGLAEADASADWHEAVRHAVFTERVEHLLGWPDRGWYAERVREEPDAVAAYLSGDA